MKITLQRAALVLALTVTSCSHPEDAAPPAGAAPVRVRVEAVRRGPMSDTLTVTGETAALSVLRLASPVAGRVAVLSVRPGDRLAQGEVAARVISFENEAALRGFTLLAGTTATGPEEHRVAQRLQTELGARTVPLRAPFPAVVAERLHNPGELLAQGDVVLELFDPASLYVLAQVPVEAAARVRVGQPVEISVGEQVATATVAALLTALVPQTLTVPVRLMLARPLEPPLLHAAVQCRIALAGDPNALVVPRSALLSSRVAQQGVIMVVVNDQVRRRTIELGMRSAKLVEVRAGLDAGERVLVDGHYALPEGTPIEAVTSSAE